MPVTRHIYTDLEIVNMALTAMGEDPLQDLQTDESTSAQIMRENYTVVAESALTSSNWRFATTKVSLNKLSAVPPNRWAAAWQLPPDHLKTLFVWPPSNYEINGQRILTNDTSRVDLDYIRKIEEAVWPPWFVRYVAARLVKKTCKGITGDDANRDMNDEHDDARSDALFQDAQQQPNQTILPSAFIDVRY